MTDYETLLVTINDGVARVSLNRPQVRNAINEKMQKELRDVWTKFRYDDDVRCVTRCPSLRGRARVARRSRPKSVRRR